MWVFPRKKQQHLKEEDDDEDEEELKTKSHSVCLLEREKYN
ncbi:hypothetical protein PP707_01465 [Acetobacter pasteurianus]|nr:hypothetical protein [Acetobacter pasteurianus]